MKRYDIIKKLKLNKQTWNIELTITFKIILSNNWTKIPVHTDEYKDIIKNI